MGAGMPILMTASTMDPLWKKVRTSGISAAMPLRTRVNVVEAADGVVVIQLHLDGAGVLAGVGGVERGEVIDYADVGDYHAEVVRGDDAMDQVFDTLDVLFGDFQAGTGGGLHVDGELAGVGAREEGNAEEGIDPQAEHEYGSQGCYGQARTDERAAHQALVEIEELSESTVEGGIEAVAHGVAAGMGRDWVRAATFRGYVLFQEA